jgi:hypothetical protein
LYDHFSDGQKRVVLENAVSFIAELCQVNNNADLEKTKTGKVLTYEEYLSLLLSTATAYDNQFSSKKLMCNVFNHNITHSDDESTKDDDAYDIDAPVSLILANISDCQTKSSSNHVKNDVWMQRDKWFSLADWYCQKQATVKTATYRSKFVAARIAADQIIDLQLTLMYLGVPIQAKSLLFGDNNSVIISSSLPYSSLKKRHNALSYHRVRECIAANFFGLYKISGKLNPAEMQ